MTILSIHKYYADRDGASHYQLAVNKLFQARGHKVVPFGMHAAGNLPTPYEKYFVSETQTTDPSVQSGAWKTFARMLYSTEAKQNLGALIDAVHPSVAHLHNIYTHLSPSIFPILRRKNIPVVMTVHDYHLVSPNYMLWNHGRVEALGNRGVLRNTLSRFHKDSYAASFAQAFTFALHKKLRLYEKGVDLFICPSAYVHTQMLAAGYPKEKLRVLPHFVETQGVVPTYEGNGSVLYAGRFVEEKGVIFLLEVAARLPQARFVFAGRGPLEALMRERAETLPNVEIVGWADREALAELYGRSSIAAVPSLWPEVFGLVAVEAMAHGKPVVSSDMGGLPEVIRDGETGRVLPAGDVRAWVEAIESLQKNSSELLRMGEAARARAETVYDPKKHVDTLLSWFEEIRARQG